MSTKASELLAGLPNEWPEDLLPAIRQSLLSLGRTIVVLDDDPTGTQTVAGVPVLTSWDVNALATELARPEPIVFVLTNSRALPSQQAASLASEIGRNLLAAEQKTGRNVSVVSRGDSTLRGHFPLEVNAVADALGIADAPVLLVPFFLEGGRYTINDVHYVAEGDDLCPAGETPFARDPTFGYRESNLKSWVEEMHRRDDASVPAITAISLEEIRRGGPETVQRRLAELAPRAVCIINAASTRDIEVVVAAALRAEVSGRRFLYRTAAGVVRSLAGQSPREPLSGSEMIVPNAKAGLVVVGSHVPKTTRQLEQLVAATQSERWPIDFVEVDVSQLVNAPANDVSRKAADRVGELLEAGQHVVVTTSRELVRANGDKSDLGIAECVSNCLVDIVSGVKQQLRFLVAKGGITSSDTATKPLCIRRAVVAGQALPGVPVWKCGPESAQPGLSLVVFPGNVGDENALVNLLGKLVDT